MATSSDLIKRALRLLGVLDSVSEMRADQTAAGLAALRAMLNAWKYDGMSTLPSFDSLALTDTLSTATAHDEAIAYNLALRLAPEFGAQPRPDVVQIAQDALARMRTAYFTVSEMTVPDEIARVGWRMSSGLWTS